MFCPKCGGSNPDNGLFCRSCGTDLSHVTGALPSRSSQQQLVGASGNPINLESAMTRIFTGIAFLIIAIVLGVTDMAGGRFWWFWMLIPAFGSLGAGTARYMQIRKHEAAQLGASSASVNSIGDNSLNALPPQNIEVVSPESRYRTGDLVPPSVTDNTTRHLEIDKEGQTMTLPKK
ncbi:hypothetical protein BH20ACI2_BH20ACI2_02860 [soil metagenome]